MALKTSRARAAFPAARAASTRADVAAAARASSDESDEKNPASERRRCASLAEEVELAVEARTWLRRVRRSSSESTFSEEGEVGEGVEEEVDDGARGRRRLLSPLVAEAGANIRVNFLLFSVIIRRVDPKGHL